MAEKRCRVCQAALEAPATGRPPRFCSTACRRTSENEVRRITRRLSALEDRRDHLTKELVMHEAGHRIGYGTTFVERTQVELDLVEQQITEQTSRLRDLYADIEESGA